MPGALQLLPQLVMAQMSRDDERMPQDGRFEGTPLAAAPETPAGTERGSHDDTTEVTAPWAPAEADDRGAPEGRRIDRIAARAYELYQRRGGEHGQEMQDWLEAEREIDGADDEGGAGRI
jgi:hypothetical protein